MIFSRSFWTKTLEAVVATFGSTFAGLMYLTPTPTLKDLAAAAISSGIAALYVFAKALGGTQAVAASRGQASAGKPPTT